MHKIDELRSFGVQKTERDIVAPSPLLLELALEFAQQTANDRRIMSQNNPHIPILEDSEFATLLIHEVLKGNHARSGHDEIIFSFQWLFHVVMLNFVTGNTPELMW